MCDDGLDGAAVSWVNYEEGIDQFAETLGPLMVEAGLRKVTSPAERCSTGSATERPTP